MNKQPEMHSPQPVLAATQVISASGQRPRALNLSCIVQFVLRVTRVNV